MSHRTTVHDRQQRLVQEMSERMTKLVQELSAWVTTDTHTLAALEQQVLRLSKDLLTTLLAQLVPLLLPSYDSPEHPCDCGGVASYLRDRPAQLISLLGPITLSRPYYLCACCGHGFAPLDRQLQFCAGSVSAGLEELLALLGAQADSFEAAVPILEKLTLLRVAPNTVRAATERLGAVVTNVEQLELTHALQQVPSAPLPGAVPSRSSTGAATYVSMDGTQVHFDDGWHEVKLGVVYTTVARPSPTQPEQRELHAVDLSYVADVGAAETFGPLLWREAVRRGLDASSRLVVLGDGSAWLWKSAETFFPGAVQIVDWYHASEYVWQAAHAIHSDAAAAGVWARAELSKLYNDEVATVISDLAPYVGKGEAVVAAQTYLTNNQHRMQYATYRAQGLQIGSGSIESGCKHVVGARLKQAGMMWSRAGGQAMAKVRARLKSGRWEETIAQRPPLQRGYVRQANAA